MKKPAHVRDSAWQKHLDWMKVMDSGRRPTRQQDDIMRNYFVPPAESARPDGRREEDSSDA